LRTRSAPRPPRPSSPTRRSSDLLGAVGSGLAGKAQLDQLLVAEERAARAACGELAPGEAALRREDHALGKPACARVRANRVGGLDRKSTRLNSSHPITSYAVFCL